MITFHYRNDNKLYIRAEHVTAITGLDNETATVYVLGSDVPFNVRESVTFARDKWRAAMGWCV